MSAERRRTLLASVVLVVLIAATAALSIFVAGRVAVAAVLVGAAAVLLWRRRFPAVALMIAIVAAVLLAPARQYIGALGSSGSVASLAGFGALMIWVIGRTFGRGWPASGRQPLRTALLLYVAAMLASQVAMAFRPVIDVEARAADRGLIVLAGMAGLCLLVADGIRTRAELRLLIKAIVLAGTGVAVLGIVHFMAGVDIAGMIRIPGFAGAAESGVDERSGFVRIISTTSHPIELSAVLAMVLPLALGVAFTARAPERRRLWWSCVAVLALSAPLTVSRTSVLCIGVVVLVLAIGWDRRRRIRIAVGGVVALLVVGVAAPGLLGTLRSLVFNYGADPSISTRTSDIDYVSVLFEQRPWFGRGWQTFLPDIYTYLDNQMMLNLVETGIIGTIAIVAVFVVALGQTVAVRRNTTADPDSREIAVAIAAAIATSFASWFAYDAFSFSTGRSLTFVALGLAAALWRLESRERDSGGEREQRREPNGTNVTNRTMVTS